MNLSPQMQILLVIVLPPVVALLRWQLGKSVWGNHPGGSKGYLRDCVQATIPLLPICAGCAAYGIMPEGQSRNIAAFALIGGGMVFGFTPPSRRANLRLVEARYPAGAN